MNLVLAYPPLEDPSTPYHSTAYLAGNLKKNGFRDVHSRDLNGEFINWCFEKPVFESFVAEADRRVDELAAKPALSFQEQEQLYRLWGFTDLAHTSLQDAIKGMRELSEFLDYGRYQDNASVIRRYLSYLGGLSYPASIHNFKLQGKLRYSQAHLNDLFDEELAAKICMPFVRFLEERLANDRGFACADSLGVSIIYDQQVCYGLRLARWFKTQWPDKAVLLGGTAIGAIYKRLRDRRELRRFFALADGLVIGEGETAICEIADRGFDLRPGVEVCNLVTYDPGRDQVHEPKRIVYEDLNTIGAPVYDCDWDLYLAPVRAVNYAPTRGCYWNRCTFCDYGLSDGKPTAPWRQRPVEMVIDELQHAREQHGIEYVYFAVDSMPPTYLEDLADRMIAVDLGISWSAELRLERTFTAQRCSKLARSGCVSALFGMESGCQRVLDLMNKGTKVEHMSTTIQNFANSGIAVGLMTFGGFPGETPENRQETLQFLERHKPFWSSAGNGDFIPIGGSAVVREPERFGVRLRPYEDADIIWHYDYKMIGDEHCEPAPHGDDDEENRHEDGLFSRTMGRPWAGADGLHSLVYYRAWGRDFFRKHPLARPEAPAPESDADLLRCTMRVRGHLGVVPYDMVQLFRNTQRAKELEAQLKKIPREPTRRTFEEWARCIPPLSRSSKDHYWIRGDSGFLEITPSAYRLIARGISQGLTLGALCADLGSEAVAKVLTYLRKLGKLGFLDFDLRPRADKLRNDPNATAADRVPTKVTSVARPNAA